MTRIEKTALTLLAAMQPNGGYGSDVASASRGLIGRVLIYAVMSDLEAGGLVVSNEDPPTEPHALPRMRFRITAKGVQALDQQSA